jgi:hypothetical protein
MFGPFPHSERDGYFKAFFGGASLSAARAIVWEKPRGFSYFNVMLVGSGNGGGGGCGGAAGTQRGGGTSGRSGQMQRIIMIPSFVLPDRLFILLGKGGVGGNGGANANGSNGGSGTSSWITAMEPRTVANAETTNNILSCSNLSGPSQGGLSTAQAGAPGQNSDGSPATIYAGFGHSTSALTSNGARGAYDASSAETMWGGPFSLVTSGGGGGAVTAADVVRSGGRFFSGSGSDWPMDTASTNGDGLTGSNGWHSWDPCFKAIGGGGGNGNAAGLGGRGGNGAPGCGGGGGGGGLTTGGAGGDGGDAFAFIWAYR